MLLPRTFVPAVGWLLVLVAAVRAQDEAAPSIFATTPPSNTAGIKRDAHDEVRPRAPISDRMRAALNARAAAGVAAHHATATSSAPALMLSIPSDRGDALMMERVIVNAQREQKVEPERVPGYFARAFTTGEIFHSAGRDLAINWGLKPAEATIYGTQRDAVRFELSVTLRR